MPMRSLLWLLLLGVACRGDRHVPAPPAPLADATPYKSYIVPAQPPPPYEPPRPGSPDYPRFHAWEPYGEREEAIQQALLLTLRARQRLLALDPDGDFGPNVDLDREIKDLTSALCWSWFRGRRPDLGLLEVAELYPLEFVEQANTARCGGLVVNGRLRPGPAPPPLPVVANGPSPGVTPGELATAKYELQRALMRLLRSYTRMTEDRAPAADLAAIDRQIRAVFEALCAPELDRAGIKVRRVPLDGLFEMGEVGGSTAVTCEGLFVARERRYIAGAAWPGRVPPSPVDAGTPEPVDAGPIWQ